MLPSSSGGSSGKIKKLWWPYQEAGVAEVERGMHSKTLDHERQKLKRRTQSNIQEKKKNTFQFYSQHPIPKWGVKRELLPFFSSCSHLMCRVGKCDKNNLYLVFFFWLLLRFYGNNLQHSKGNCLTKRPPKKSQKEMWPQASSLRSSIEGLHNPTIHFFLMSLVKATIIRNEKTTGYYSLMLYSFSVPPTIRPDPPDGNYVVKKGRKVELKCVASGNPDPTITWTRQVCVYHQNSCRPLEWFYRWRLTGEKWLAIRFRGKSSNEPYKLKIIHLEQLRNQEG